MRWATRLTAMAAILAACVSPPLRAQSAAPEPTPSPTPGAPSASATEATPAPPMPAPTARPTTPTPSTALRITDPPVVSIAKLPADNPFGLAAGTPAALPAKLAFTDATLSTGLFVSVHTDPTGRSLAVRRERDPIPSLAAETLKSLSRWFFLPAHKAGQPVETWGAYRLDLQVEIRAPRVSQMGFVPVTPSTAIPAPFEWLPDAEWLESRHSSKPPDGSVPIDEVDTTPIPQKTPWSADSYKGPFLAKFWVRVDKTGRIDRAIPLDVSDPVLVAYFRKAMSGWAIRPAQSGGAPVESWNELTLGGQISYSDEIKQIQALRRSLGS